jgi:hypothetical protein
MITVRDLQPGDESFVYSTWLKSLYHRSKLFNEVPADVFYANYHKHVEHLLRVSTVRVACLTEDQDVILGWAAYNKNTLHYAFTKQVWRSQGIQKKILDNHVITTVSCITDMGNKIRKAKSWEFNPWAGM